jgi:glycosyltransferase involved in cell wall biosynthesis
VPQVKFTVAMCTWNRAALLFRALEQLTRVQQPRGGWEVVVVNNNSTDETERVLDAFVGELPLRRVFEDAPGLSHARNAAIRHATGDYIVWTDDDVLVDKDWLCAYERAVDRWPEATVFGGPVRPRFEGTPPRWLSAAWQDVGSAFATRELGVEAFELASGGKVPYGPNFIVRMLEQRQFLYDPTLGRKQADGTLGEETAVIRAILASGRTGWWVPDAVVEHWIPKERQTTRYLRSYYALVGKTLYRRNPHGAPMLSGGPRWLWRKTLQAQMAYAFARLSGNPHRWLKSLAEASILWGAIKK